jgi:hypothetical protein
MTPTEQDILRTSLEKTTDAFFRKRAAKKSKLVLGNSRPKTVDIDATGLLAVLSGWVGELIEGAPENMRDHLFLAFADNAAEVAGIKEQDCACDDCMPVATETLQ